MKRRSMPVDNRPGATSCWQEDRHSPFRRLCRGSATSAKAQAGAKPNIVVIMGDDIGIWNIGAYHRGMMAGRTPNLDKLAKEGMLFTDYYAEASCTAGRAAFITGELADPHRHDHGRPGRVAKIGLPAEA